MTGVNISIDEKSIEGQVKSIVAGSIASVFARNNKDLIQLVIDSALSQKVNDKGESSSWGTPFIEWLASGTVRKAVQEAMQEYVEENKELIKERVKKQLKDKKQDILEKMATEMINSIPNKIYTTVNMSMTMKGSEY